MFKTELIQERDSDVFVAAGDLYCVPLCAPAMDRVAEKMRVRRVRDVNENPHD
jgi:hypothetical protein